MGHGTTAVERHRLLFRLFHVLAALGGLLPGLLPAVARHKIQKRHIYHHFCDPLNHLRLRFGYHTK